MSNPRLPKFQGSITWGKITISFCYINYGSQCEFLFYGYSGGGGQDGILIIKLSPSIPAILSPLSIYI